MFNNGISSGDNSNTVNTKGDGNITNITNTNIDTKTVEVIVKGILYDSLPKFQEQAKHQVKESIKIYIDDLIKELEIQKTSNELINTKLPNPDIQYSIFESAKAYAKSPERAEKDTSINLVVNKINTDSDDFDELSELDMAIEAASKMNCRQIKALALVRFSLNIVKFGLSPTRGYLPLDPARQEDYHENDDYYFFHGEIVRSKDEINKLYIDKYNREIIEIFPDGDIKNTNFHIPLSLGCIRKSPFEKITIEQIIMKRTGLNINKEKDALIIHPFIDRMNAIGGVEEFSSIILTEVGDKVANAYISTKMRLIN